MTPGSLNLMTAGRGIGHTEYPTADTTVLHGTQLWLAPPNDSRDTDPGFEAYTPEPLSGEDWDLRVFLGGTPFGEQITMWWNFVGRPHEEIVAHRDARQSAIGADDAPPAADPHGRVPGAVALPAPTSPAMRLKPGP